MFEILFQYWPQLLAVVSIVLGGIAAIHATMTKDEVRTALGWVGVIVLSPIVGAIVYAVAGINRIRRKTLSHQRTHNGSIALYHLSQVLFETVF